MADVVEGIVAAGAQLVHDLLHPRGARLGKRVDEYVTLVKFELVLPWRARADRLEKAPTASHECGHIGRHFARVRHAALFLFAQQLRSRLFIRGVGDKAYQCRVMSRMLNAIYSAFFVLD